MRWLLVLAACSVLTDASPLHAASARGDVKKVRSLLERGMYGVDLQEADGSTALMVAAAFGYSSVVKQLLGSGANLELKDQTGMTALSWCACAKGREELIPQLMPAGAAAHAGRKVLKTYDQLGVTQLLLRQGAEIEALDFGGWSALMVASFYGQPEIATLLVEAGARTDHLRLLWFAAASAAAHCCWLREQQWRLRKAILEIVILQGSLLFLCGTL